MLQDNYLGSRKQFSASTVCPADTYAASGTLDGDVDCDLTLIYGVNTTDEIIYKEKWGEFEKASNGRLKLVTVVANEDAVGCEKGFISLDIVKKYADVMNSSFFISGPPAMVKHVKAFLEPLGIKRKFIRVSMSGDAPFNSVEGDKTEYVIKTHLAGEVFDVKAKSNETILTALERSGLKPAVRCSSGKCGFCRAMVVRGTFRLTDVEDGVRRADKKLGFVHPCCSYPSSDMEIIVHRV